MKWVKKFFRLKMYVWMALSLLLLLSGVGLYGYWSGRLEKVGTVQESLSVKYLEEVKEVVFLNVGLQRVESKKTNTKIPWTKIGIPATEKQALIILNDEAKLGIKQPVSISQSIGKTVTVVVPPFEVIGIALDKQTPYQLYDERNGLLSWRTEKIDTAELALKKLSNQEQEEYLEAYQENMKQSATLYYQSIIKSIDPDLEVNLVFAR